LNFLENILVVSIEQAVAASLCSSRLADAGARVIKVEREEGDFARYYDKDVKGESAYFVWLNRGKESLVVNLKDENDRSIVKNIIQSADVYIQNLIPGAIDRLSLSSKKMRELNNRLITCDISGYGQTGPYRDMKAYDLLVQAVTGLCSITGTPDRPGRVGVSVCDIACGLNAHSAILQALYSREKTGVGAGIEVSLFDGMADWMNVPFLQTKYGNRKVKRAGLSHPSIAPYGAFESLNGRNILIAIQNEREWISLCATVLMKPELVKDLRFDNPVKRIKNRDTLDKIIADIFVKFDQNYLVKKLRESKIACGVLNEIEDLELHKLF
jgi:crotonobetainyl-CoA:carnitine CoA-transferase CaiB-like acyl-CoA transferase